MGSAVSEAKHGGALKEELVGPLCRAAEDWMYGEGEDSDLAGYQDYLKTLQANVRAACPEWFAAEEAERKRIEEELTAQYQVGRRPVHRVAPHSAEYDSVPDEGLDLAHAAAALWRCTQAALAEGKDKEDHDFRKMAKPERMRLVNLNKEEANELFKVRDQPLPWPLLASAPCPLSACRVD
jgi:hypothetical protein